MDISDHFARRELDRLDRLKKEIRNAEYLLQEGVWKPLGTALPTGVVILAGFVIIEQNPPDRDPP